MPNFSKENYESGLWQKEEILSQAADNSGSDRKLKSRLLVEGVWMLKLPHQVCPLKLPQDTVPARQLMYQETRISTLGEALLEPVLLLLLGRREQTSTLKMH